MPDDPVVTEVALMEVDAAAVQPTAIEGPNIIHDSSPNQRRVHAELRGSFSTVGEVEASLSVGEIMVVQGKLRSQPYKAPLAGWVPGESIFISPSLAVLASGQIVKDEFLLVRYLFLGNVFGFETTATKVILDPPLVILEWPERVEVAAVTREARFMAKVPIMSVFYNSQGEVVGRCKGSLIELSLGGCRIKTHWQNELMEFYLPGSRISLETPLNLGGLPLKLDCVLRNFSRQGDLIIMGLQIMGEKMVKDRINTILELQLMR